MAIEKSRIDMFKKMPVNVELTGIVLKGALLYKKRYGRFND